MKVAAIISSDGKSVVPLVDGPVIRVRDLDSGTQTELQNPALFATRARRIATVQEMLQHGVEAVVSPPGAFCAHSYKVAKDNGIQFWDVSAGTTWEELWNGEEFTADLLTREIPDENLASHHPHSHHDHS